MNTSDQASNAPSSGESGVDLKDNAYVLGHHGFIYTSNRLPMSSTVRHPAVLIISVNHEPFKLTLRNGVQHSGTAIMVPPRVERILDSRGIPILSINVTPGHPSYHVFRGTQKGEVVQLDRNSFNHLDAEFELLLKGQANIDEAELIFSRAVSAAERLLPTVRPPDPRALSMIRMLDADADLSFDELAKRLGYSPQTMSRLFSSAVGMSLRDYQNWIKTRRVYDVLYTPRSLTQVAHRAGFSDSPQFTRAYKRWYGDTPSNARDPRNVRVFVHGGSNQPSSTPDPSTD